MIADSVPRATGKVWSAIQEARTEELHVIWLDLAPQAHRESHGFLLHSLASLDTHQTAQRPVQYAFHNKGIHHNMATTGDRDTHGVHHFSTPLCAGNGDDSARRGVF